MRMAPPRRLVADYAVLVRRQPRFADERARAPLAPVLLMHRRPVGPRQATAYFAALAPEQPGLEIGLAQALWQRPRQAGLIAALQMTQDRRVVGPEARADLAQCQTAGTQPLC